MRSQPMGSGVTVGEIITKRAAAQIALSGLAGAVIAQVVGSAEGGVDAVGIAQDLVSIGGPIALGAAVGAAIIPPGSSSGTQMERFLKRGAIAALVASGVSMYAGLLPTTLDMQTLNFGLVVMGSVYVGDTIADQITTV